MFAALRLDQRVNGSLQELLTEAAVQLRDRIRWGQKRTLDLQLHSVCRQSVCVCYLRLSER